LQGGVGRRHEGEAGGSDGGSGEQQRAHGVASWVRVMMIMPLSQRQRQLCNHRSDLAALGYIQGRHLYRA
jgi:hypothetical protein